MTTFTVPRTDRAISEDMFADLGIPQVTFTATGSRMRVTCPQTLSAANVIRGKIRLLTATTADEAMLTLALDALTEDNDYLAIGAPSTIQAVAQVRALTQQVRALILWAGRDILTPTP